MQIDRKCINCTSFPCMKEECAKDNVCNEHKFEHEKIIEELEGTIMKQEKIEQNIDEVIINIDKLTSIPTLEYENPYEIKERKNRSALQFNGDTFYTLYTETKFNKFQKFLWKYLLNIKITDVED